MSMSMENSEKRYIDVSHNRDKNMHTDYRNQQHGTPKQQVDDERIVVVLLNMSPYVWWQ